MASRKAFVAAAIVSVGALTNAAANAQSTASPSPSPSPSPAARDFALRMRAFDPQLTDEEIEEIAAGVEQNWALGKSVNPSGRALKNSDEPDPAFSV
ncbi:MAG: hypothetical protein JO092_07705 [Candidatus Eremiobacteraeota bacterium]|nr:hypothetical protein [Candidatus Eremiobacteraeota bacterium]MBV8373888.1 hypothetical protein [Candidatus Eremiobacteraeota bacterium]